jgi:hypothetical protein
LPARYRPGRGIYATNQDRRGFHFRGTKLPVAVNNNAMNVFSPIGPAVVPSAILIKFVKALAVRQANLDAGLNLKAANDNEPGVLH